MLNSYAGLNDGLARQTLNITHFCALDSLREGYYELFMHFPFNGRSNR